MPSPEVRKRAKRLAVEGQVKFGAIQRVKTPGPRGMTDAEREAQLERITEGVRADPERFVGTRTERTAKRYVEARRKRKRVSSASDPLKA